SLIKQSKKGRPAHDLDVRKMQSVDQHLTNNGQLATRDNARSASFGDMFTGDEVGNAVTVDASKLQMFFFTIVVVTAYALAIGSLFGAASPPDAFPTINETLVTLLVISHGGYLAYKAAPHSAQTP